MATIQEEWQELGAAMNDLKRAVRHYFYHCLWCLRKWLVR